MRNNKTQSILSALVVIAMLTPVVVSAQSSSSNYRVDESAFSSGSNFDANSTNFNAQGSAGLNAIGSASSTNFDVVAGLITPDVPFLEFYVTGATVDLGVLDPNTTASGAAQAGACSCSFYVRSYVSSSYVVTTMSNPPTSEAGEVLDAKAVQAIPTVSASVEEFGINVVANTSPAIGADPDNQPDNTFADGVAAVGYDTPNQFKYALGDVIARAAGTANTKAWGQTDYTISYIAKSGTLTPAGLYSMDHIIVATAVY
jgi:hypothetical protein